MTSPFRRLGEWVVHHRAQVIIVWVLLTVIAVFGARHVGEVFRGDISRTPGSESARIDDFVHGQFDRQFPHTFLYTLTSDRNTVDDPPYTEAIDRMTATLLAHPKVGSVFSYRDDASLVSADRHHTFLLVGLRVDDFRQATQLVKPLSELGHSVPLPPGLTMAVTGNAPISVDMEHASSEDGARTELKVLPLALAVMVLLFGALVAAVVPVVIGLMACTMAFALLFVIGQFVELNVFTQNFVTMMGLGVGIDYSLFIVSRFREELGAGFDKHEAAIRATETAGRSIAFSGMAVCIGMFALLIPNLPLTRALGIGGLLAVLLTVVLSLTFLPAMLAMLGDRINSPRAFNRFIVTLSRSKAFWSVWSQRMMRRPLLYLTISVGILLALSAMTLHLKTWNSNILLMPNTLEARRGFAVLTKTAGERQISPIGIGISMADGSPLYRPENMALVYDFSRQLQKEVALNRVLSIVDINPAMTLDDYQGLMQNMLTLRVFNPQSQNPLLSRDDQKTIMWVVPVAGTSDRSHWDLTIAMRAFRDAFAAKHPNMQVIIGGGAALGYDFEMAIFRDFPVVVAAIVVTTFLVIMLSFRSLLLPLKSVVSNLLSVSASIGVLVAVFQYGWGASYLGIATPPGALLHMTPMALFCIIFGLSMDYEIFLMSRIKEAYDLTGDAEGSVTVGLETTGGIITSAAMIMIIVFCGFAFAETILVKEMGLGLAVAIALDVTIIRLLLVPSFMGLVGKACWWFPESWKRFFPEMDLRH
ncbi:MAG: MMPL family transporter [Candidatus Sericytochromatia bacterium]|nr:MMPL family transporter [Candidatus Sericytochromatia bacterium]